MNNMDCIFCKIIAGEIPCHNVFENEHVIAFIDIHPCNPGHTLVVPKQHCENLLETPPDIAHHMMDVVQELAPRVMRAVGAHGFNLGVNTGIASGQAIKHTHAHIIPRFTDDGLRHWPEKVMSQEEFAGVAEKIRAAV